MASSTSSWFLKFCQIWVHGRMGRESRTGMWSIWERRGLNKALDWTEECFQCIFNWPKKRNPVPPESRMNYALFLSLFHDISAIWSTYFTPIRICWCLFDRFFKRCPTVQWCAFSYMVYLALWRDTCNHHPEWTHCLLKSRWPEPGQLWKALMEELVIATGHWLHLDHGCSFHIMISAEKLCYKRVMHNCCILGLGFISSLYIYSFIAEFLASLVTLSWRKININNICTIRDKWLLHLILLINLMRRILSIFGIRGSIQFCPLEYCRLGFCHEFLKSTFRKFFFI